MATTSTQSQSTIREEVAAALKRLESKDPGLKQLLKKAYGHAVFPTVGKAALVVGGAYGRGAVFEQGKFIGYATIGQTTIGVQIGGNTFTEVIAFENKQALERFKQGKTASAASASAVLVKAGAAASADYQKGAQVFVYSEGGMMLEAAIGGQRLFFRPAVLGRAKTATRVSARRRPAAASKQGRTARRKPPRKRSARARSA